MLNKHEEQTKYNALWLSHSSVSDFLKCERLYYLRNLWKNKNGKKINLVSPQLSLGLAVHQVLEPLAEISVLERVTWLDKNKLDILGENDLIKKYNKIWENYSGIRGGFVDSLEEEKFKERGLKMLKNVLEHPGPLLRKTIKFYKGDFIPNVYLSEEQNIILCGLVDWVEYLEDSDELRVVDFKTGTREEKEDSLQLMIYKILVEGLQRRKVRDGAYWYLDRHAEYRIKDLTDEDVKEVKSKLLEIGLKIKYKKSVNNFEKNFLCSQPLEKYLGNCKFCYDAELIYKFDKDSLLDDEKKKIKYLGIGEYKQDLYFIKK